MRPRLIATLLLALFVAGCAGPSPNASPTPTGTAAPTVTYGVATATPPGTACTGELTAAQDEGPFFKSGSPEETSLVGSGLPGTPLTLTGLVFDPSCQPIAGASLDFWQADDVGFYDNEGYDLRGHLASDATGAYAVKTILPGRYVGRTPHIHVKIQVPGGPVLTTQLYVPGDPANANDQLYDPRLQMNIVPSDEGLEATFTFVVATQ
jgi:protocatechuate 3,4-dioxygenase beta subunit